MRNVLLAATLAIPILSGATQPNGTDGSKEYVKILSAEVRGKIRMPEKVTVGHPEGITAYVEVWGQPRYWLDLRAADEPLRKRALKWKDRIVILEGPVEIRPAVDAEVSLPFGSPKPVVEVLLPRALDLAGEKK